jgi:hypothetical protein
MAHQDRYGGAQQPEVQQVEQGTGDRTGVPPADRFSDQGIAAVVDDRPGGVPPGQPFIT